ncbi:hypothetical protein BESB_008510 [Besnoitia besnoiti]|uniref:Uncharacterized protein n=1 Tax=Besnoitia besnoiti TaxID=94643 RepID=A0A2A9MKN4_BESBE|nr:hypothetical protein BESB_008510 [Besnoitia besnoiti]PFH38509.1 hypothetical protein BESB_008510 [Besnoitia besnoiti]
MSESRHDADMEEALAPRSAEVCPFHDVEPATLASPSPTPGRSRCARWQRKGDLATREGATLSRCCGAEDFDTESEAASSSQLGGFAQAQFGKHEERGGIGIAPVRMRASAALLHRPPFASQQPSGHVPAAPGERHKAAEGKRGDNELSEDGGTPRGRPRLPRNERLEIGVTPRHHRGGYCCETQRPLGVTRSLPNRLDRQTESTEEEAESESEADEQETAEAALVSPATVSLDPHVAFSSDAEQRIQRGRHHAPPASLHDMRSGRAAAAGRSPASRREALSVEGLWHAGRIPLCSSSAVPKQASSQASYSLAAAVSAASFWGGAAASAPRDSSMQRMRLQAKALGDLGVDAERPGSPLEVPLRSSGVDAGVAPRFRDRGIALLNSSMHAREGAGRVEPTPARRSETRGEFGPAEAAYAVLEWSSGCGAQAQHTCADPPPACGRVSQGSPTEARLDRGAGAAATGNGELESARDDEENNAAASKRTALRDARAHDASSEKQEGDGACRVSVGKTHDGVDALERVRLPLASHSAFVISPAPPLSSSGFRPPSSSATQRAHSARRLAANSDEDEAAARRGAWNAERDEGADGSGDEGREATGEVYRGGQPGTASFRGISALARPEESVSTGRGRRRTRRLRLNLKSVKTFCPQQPCRRFQTLRRAHLLRFPLFHVRLLSRAAKVRKMQHEHRRLLSLLPHPKSLFAAAAHVSLRHPARPQSPAAAGSARAPPPSSHSSSRSRAATAASPARSDASRPPRDANWGGQEAPPSHSSRFRAAAAACEACASRESEAPGADDEEAEEEESASLPDQPNSADVWRDDSLSPTPASKSRPPARALRTVRAARRRCVCAVARKGKKIFYTHCLSAAAPPSWCSCASSASSWTARLPASGSRASSSRRAQQNPIFLSLQGHAPAPPLPRQSSSKAAAFSEGSLAHHEACKTSSFSLHVASQARMRELVWGASPAGGLEATLRCSDTQSRRCRTCCSSVSFSPSDRRRPKSVANRAASDLSPRESVTAATLHWRQTATAAFHAADATSTDESLAALRGARGFCGARLNSATSGEEARESEEAKEVKGLSQTPPPPLPVGAGPHAQPEGCAELAARDKACEGVHPEERERRAESHGGSERGRDAGGRVEGEAAAERRGRLTEARQERKGTRHGPYPPQSSLVAKVASASPAASAEAAGKGSRVRAAHARRPAYREEEAGEGEGEACFERLRAALGNPPTSCPLQHCPLLPLSCRHSACCDSFLRDAEKREFGGHSCVRSNFSSTTDILFNKYVREIDNAERQKEREELEAARRENGEVSEIAQLQQIVVKSTKLVYFLIIVNIVVILLCVFFALFPFHLTEPEPSMSEELPEAGLRASPEQGRESLRSLGALPPSASNVPSLRHATPPPYSARSFELLPSPESALSTSASALHSSAPPLSSAAPPLSSAAPPLSSPAPLQHLPTDAGDPLPPFLSSSGEVAGRDARHRAARRRLFEERAVGSRRRLLRTSNEALGARDRSLPCSPRTESKNGVSADAGHTPQGSLRLSAADAASGEQPTIRREEKHAGVEAVRRPTNEELEGKHVFSEMTNATGGPLVVLTPLTELAEVPVEAFKDLVIVLKIYPADGEQGGQRATVTKVLSVAAAEEHFTREAGQREKKKKVVFFYTGESLEIDKEAALLRNSRGEGVYAWDFFAETMSPLSPSQPTAVARARSDPLETCGEADGERRRAEFGAAKQARKVQESASEVRHTRRVATPTGSLLRPVDIPSLRGEASLATAEDEANAADASARALEPRDGAGRGAVEGGETGDKHPAALLLRSLDEPEPRDATSTGRNAEAAEAAEARRHADSANATRHGESEAAAGAASLRTAAAAERAASEGTVLATGFARRTEFPFTAQTSDRMEVQAKVAAPENSARATSHTDRAATGGDPSQKRGAGTERLEMEAKGREGDTHTGARNNTRVDWTKEQQAFGTRREAVSAAERFGSGARQPQEAVSLTAGGGKDAPQREANAAELAASRAEAERENRDGAGRSVPERRSVKEPEAENRVPPRRLMANAMLGFANTFDQFARLGGALLSPAISIAQTLDVAGALLANPQAATLTPASLPPYVSPSSSSLAFASSGYPSYGAYHAPQGSVMAGVAANTPPPPRLPLAVVEPNVSLATASPAYGPAAVTQSQPHQLFTSGAPQQAIYYPTGLAGPGFAVSTSTVDTSSFLTQPVSYYGAVPAGATWTGSGGYQAITVAASSNADLPLYVFATGQENPGSPQEALSARDGRYLDAQNGAGAGNSGQSGMLSASLGPPLRRLLAQRLASAGAGRQTIGQERGGNERGGKAKIQECARTDECAEETPGGRGGAKKTRINLRGECAAAPSDSERRSVAATGLADGAGDQWSCHGAVRAYAEIEIQQRHASEPTDTEAKNGINEANGASGEEEHLTHLYQVDERIEIGKAAEDVTAQRTHSSAVSAKKGVAEGVELPRPPASELCDSE